MLILNINNRDCKSLGCFSGLNCKFSPRVVNLTRHVELDSASLCSHETLKRVQGDVMVQDNVMVQGDG